MELIVQFLMVLICIVAGLKLSHVPRWYSWLYALVVGIFIVLTGDWTSNQPKALMSSYIEHRELREDIAILVTLESMLFILFTFLRLTTTHTPNVLRNRLRKVVLAVLTFYPSLLVFPILLYTQSQIFITMVGYDFSVLSWCFAAVMVLFFGLSPMGHRRLLPERELRLELLFLSSLFIFIFGLITTVDDKMTYSAPDYVFPWKGFLIAMALLVFCMIVGFCLPYLKRIIYKQK